MLPELDVSSSNKLFECHSYNFISFHFLSRPNLRKRISQRRVRKTKRIKRKKKNIRKVRREVIHQTVMSGLKKLLNLVKSQLQLFPCREKSG